MPVLHDMVTDVEFYVSLIRFVSGGEVQVLSAHS